MLAAIEMTAQQLTQVDNYQEGLALIKRNGQFGFINKEKELIIPCIYDSAFSFTSIHTPVKKDTNWFYIDKKGDFVFKNYVDTSKSITYAEARPFYNGLAVVRNHGDNGYYPILIYGGGAYVDFFCDSLGDFVDGYAEIVHGNGHGIIDESGDYLVNTEYDDVDSFSNGWVKVRLNGHWMILNPYGECVKNCRGDVLLPRKRNTNWTAITFPNYGKVWLDDINRTKVDNLLHYMRSNPEQRMVFTGFGNSSYVAQQRSWDYVHTIIEYLVKRGINRKQCIFWYGRNGKYRTVHIRKAKKGEDGPSNTPPPFPSMSLD